MEDEKQIGVCKYCGQSKMIQTIGEVSQARLNEIATNECQCGGARAERELEERRANIESYLKEVPEYSRSFFKAAINAVQDEDTEIESITIVTSDGWRTQLSMKGDHIKISPKKSLSKERII